MISKLSINFKKLMSVLKLFAIASSEFSFLISKCMPKSEVDME